jgi:hypothetical protein
VSTSFTLASLENVLNNLLTFTRSEEEEEEEETDQ